MPNSSPSWSTWVNPMALRFKCETCGQFVSPKDCLVQEEYGFEGEAWGTMFREGSFLIAVTPCCRSAAVNQYDNPMTPEDVGWGAAINC